MADDTKHDPLDPLEAAYTGGDDPFHGEPIEEAEDIPAYDSGAAAPPPPPPVSIGSRILQILLFAGGLLILILLIYAGYRFIKRGGTRGSVELTYWVLWEEEDVLKSLIDKYQKDHSNVTVKYVRQTPIQYRERLQAHIARGEGPDIFRFHNTWVPMLREELATLPESVLSSKDFSEIFYPIASEDLLVGGKIVGIPLMYDGLLVFYNKDIFSAGGFSKPADNWNDLLSQANELTVKDAQGKIQTAGAAVGRADNIEHFSDILGLLMLQNGANPARPNSEAGKGALEFYYLFSQTPDNVWGAEFDNDILAFAGGRAALIFAPSWEIFTIRAINPELNFAVSSVPQVAGSGSSVSWASYWAEGVNSRSRNQNEAWEFLAFLAQKENLEEFFLSASQTRAFGEPYPRRDMADLLLSNEFLSPLIDSAENAKSFYMASRTFDNGVNDKVIQYYRQAVDSLDEGNSSEAALDTAQQGIQQVLQQFNIKVE